MISAILRHLTAFLFGALVVFHLQRSGRSLAHGPYVRRYVRTLARHPDRGCVCLFPVVGRHHRDEYMVGMIREYLRLWKVKRRLKKGEWIRMPKTLNELPDCYKQLIRELSKR